MYVQIENKISSLQDFVSITIIVYSKNKFPTLNYLFITKRTTYKIDYYLQYALLLRYRHINHTRQRR